MKSCPISNQSTKPTAPIGNDLNVFAPTPSTSSRFPAYAPASASIMSPIVSLPHSDVIRVFALTHSRRIVFQRSPWFIPVLLDDFACAQGQYNKDS
jgi:hypothetical protein